MFYYLLALVSGTFITFQVSINGKLLSQIGSPLLTSLISFIAGTAGLGLVYIGSICLGMESLPTMQTLTQPSFWLWTGGLFGAFYIFSTVICLPSIGIANMLSLVIAGQFILAIVFDHFGLLGSPVHTISPQRLIGVILLIVSVYLIQTN
ncbi:MAG: DMT family transporter [Pelosinus sp.]|nr:DMT family transporter [Pelosinus sp.]